MGGRAGTHETGLGNNGQSAILSRAAQRAFARAPAGCNVAKKAGKKSFDMTKAYADAACLAFSGRRPANWNGTERSAANQDQAGVCGPYAPSKHDIHVLDRCLLLAPLFFAWFVAEALGKPGLAGMELVSEGIRFLTH